MFILREKDSYAIGYSWKIWTPRDSKHCAWCSEKFWQSLSSIAFKLQVSQRREQVHVHASSLAKGEKSKGADRHLWLA